MKDIEKLIFEHKKRVRRKKAFAGIKKAIDIASSVSSTILLLRDKPRALDYFSIGTTLTNTGLKIYDEISRINVSDPRKFFNAKTHYTIPYTLEKTVYKFLDNVELLLKSDKISLYRGYLLNHEIFWIQNDQVKEKPFCKAEEINDVIDTIGYLLWQHNGSDNIMLDKGGHLIQSDESLDFEVVETNAMKALEKRLISFKNDGTSRSYLLEGPPGTGKSSAAIHLIRKLGLKSLRTALSSIYGNNWREQGKADTNLDVLLRALKPDMIIIDDIDRSHMNDQEMLKLFETSRKYCKIIMATCNNKNSMIGAMLRVGRFDDHIEINHVDVEVIQGMLDEEDADLAERMVYWPIAYIQNYKTVKRVMGRKQARSEIDDMEARIFEIERKTMNEGGWHMATVASVEEEEEEDQNTPAARRKRNKAKG